MTPTTVVVVEGFTGPLFFGGNLCGQVAEFLPYPKPLLDLPVRGHCFLTLHAREVPTSPATLPYCLTVVHHAVTAVVSGVV